MRRRRIILFLIASLSLVGVAGAKVHLSFDCGGCGPLQDGWISIPTCGTYTNVGNSGIDVRLWLPVEPQGDCHCASYFDKDSDGPATGPLAYVEQDFIYVNDRPGSPGSDIVITFSNLVHGAQYRVLSYHNRLDEKQTTIQAVEVSGATYVTKPDRIDQEHNRIINPAEIKFTAGEQDVSLRYVAPPKKRKQGQVFLNGFTLEGGRPDVSFESAASSGLEDEKTVGLKVVLSDPQKQPVTVRYAVTGGTATNLDYVLKPGTLTFNPGETEKSINIGIVKDGMDEQDETVEVTLLNVKGGDVEMGAMTKHTYTIIDPRPAIGFVPARAVKLESESPVEVTIKLSGASKSTVTVDYSLAGGTAKAGVDYKELRPGKLVFEPGQTSNTLEIELIKDTLKEEPEQIVLELSNPINAKLDASQYTCTIVDGWASYAFEMFKVDLGCKEIPNTFKPGWTQWEIGACDNQAHQGSTLKNIAGSGVDAYISIGGDKPTGNLRLREGEALCNSYYSYFNNYAVEAPVELRLSGLAAGEYWLYSYHNSPDIKTMPRVTASGPGVAEITGAKWVRIQAERSDEKLVPSLLRFYTDGYGPVTITYYAPQGYNAVLNAFELDNTVTPLYATNPSPHDKAKNVSPDVVLGWVPGAGAASHAVYLGTDADAVQHATKSSPQYKATVSENSFKPPLLAFGQTYYWRLDEVDEGRKASPCRSEVWRFTVDRGHARNPVPADGGNAISSTTLSWSPGEYGKQHDVYFGTSEAAVKNAAKSSSEFKGSLTATAYKPEALTNGSTYYWRVDEVGKETTVTGDVWKFSVTPPVHLKVDFALPMVDGTGLVEGSAKPGWWHWAAPVWADMYMHDGVWENGANFKPSDKGIEGTGVHAFITTGSEGQLGLHVKGMCRDNLAGGGTPTGTPKGEPIANSWLYAVDWPGEYKGDIMLVLTDLPAGRYELVSYHNHWEPCSQKTRHCMDCVCSMPPMPSVTANPLPETPLHGYSSHWGLPQGTGKGVKAITNAFDVPVTYELADANASTSRIVFETDGSQVLVIYKAADNSYPDCGRKNREGSRGILNAFELSFVTPSE